VKVLVGTIDEEGVDGACTDSTVDGFAPSPLSICSSWFGSAGAGGMAIWTCEVGGTPDAPICGTGSFAICGRGGD
jgi:hypothetical protein